MYKVIIYSSARRKIKKLPKNYQRAIILALRELKEDPLTGKPLTRELTGKLSFRVGVYRIIYKVNQKDKVVYILSAGHRSIVYT